MGFWREASTALVCGAALVAPAPAAALEAPVGYLGTDQVFPDGAAGADGFGDIVFGMEIRSPLADAAGTFWSNQFTFTHSDEGLPANLAPGNQGGYIGLQAHTGAPSLAIVSIWWASEAVAGPGAECVSDIEAWYADDRPWEPAIDAMEDSDPNRQVDGGPFRSCRLKVALQSNVAYRLRLQSDGDGWWSAWLEGEGGAEPALIGRLRVPAPWGGIDQGDLNGFMERFTDLPKGCASIAPSTSVFAPAVADDGTVTATAGAGLYGVCEGALKPRTTITPEAGGGVRVEIE